MISGFVVDTPAYSLFYFGFAVFLTMFAVVVADQMPLSAGLAFVIAEISGMVIALRFKKCSVYFMKANLRQQF